MRYYSTFFLLACTCYWWTAVYAVLHHFFIFFLLPACLVILCKIGPCHSSASSWSNRVCRFSQNWLAPRTKEEIHCYTMAVKPHPNDWPSPRVNAWTFTQRLHPNGISRIFGLIGTANVRQTRGCSHSTRIRSELRAIFVLILFTLNFLTHIAANYIHFKLYVSKIKQNNSYTRMSFG